MKKFVTVVTIGIFVVAGVFMALLSFIGNVFAVARPVTLSATPLTINQGKLSQLVWTSENNRTCLASGGWSGSRLFTGVEAVYPAVTTTYTITCSTASGQKTSSSVTVAVIPAPVPVITLNASSSIITQGKSATLSWTSINTVNCTSPSEWKLQGRSGTLEVTPLITTLYTLTCVGSVGQKASSSVTVTVIPAPGSAVTLNASSSTIIQGKSSTLSWTSVNARTCTASDGWTGAQKLAGKKIVTPKVTTRYTLICANGTGQKASSSVTVAVTPLVATCLINPLRIQLEWVGKVGANSNSLQKGDIAPNDPNLFWGFILQDKSLKMRKFTDTNVLSDVLYTYRVKYSPSDASKEVQVMCPTSTVKIPS